MARFELFLRSGAVGSIVVSGTDVRVSQVLEILEKMAAERNGWVVADEGVALRLADIVAVQRTDGRGTLRR